MMSFGKSILRCISPKYLFTVMLLFAITSIFHGCMVLIEKSVTRDTDRHHEAEACRVMPNSDPE